MDINTLYKKTVSKLLTNIKKKTFRFFFNMNMFGKQIYQCINCNSTGHHKQHCPQPISSTGVIAFRYNTRLKCIQYLTIRRQYTIAFTEIIRGKYNLYDKNYIMVLLHETTSKEKENLLQLDFNVMWALLWNINSVDLSTSPKLSVDDKQAKLKFESLKSGGNTKFGGIAYNLASLLKEITTHGHYVDWQEPEWGFPKGRHEHGETLLVCAAREFHEETGYSALALNFLTNVKPLEEIFLGSNNKAYIHKYVLAQYIEQDEKADDDDTAEVNVEGEAHNGDMPMDMNMDMDIIKDDGTNKYNVIFNTSEVSKVEWKSVLEVEACIRKQHVHKLDVIRTAHHILSNYFLFY